MNGKKAKMLRKAAKVGCEQTGAPRETTYKALKNSNRVMNIGSKEDPLHIPINIHGGTVVLEKGFRHLYKRFKRQLDGATA